MGTADGISKKKTLYEESTSATPAVANSADELLILAWAVHEPAYSGFKVAWALDAFHFSQPSSVFDSLFALEPALAADGSHFYLGWTASTPPTRTVKVAVSADPSFAQMDFMTLHTDSATSVPLS